VVASLQTGLEERILGGTDAIVVYPGAVPVAGKASPLGALADDGSHDTTTVTTNHITLLLVLVEIGIVVFTNGAVVATALCGNKATSHGWRHVHCIRFLVQWES